MSYFANYMARYGERMAVNRWPMLPIAPGEKYPGQFSWGEWEPAKAWQERLNILPSDADLALWREWPGCGIGICCGYIVGIDIDLSDGRAAFEAEQTARRMLGDTPFVRIGNYPKRMLVYRSEKPFSSLNGAGVQVLALGRQFVAFGIHPQTRKPYEWLEENPVDCDSENLPTITEFQARQFIAAIGTAPEMRLSRASPDKRQQSVKGQYGTLEAVRSAIEALPNPDLHYDDWIKIGLALKGSLPGDATRNLCARMVGAIRQGQSGLDREEMGRSDE